MRHCIIFLFFPTVTMCIVKLLHILCIRTGPLCFSEIRLWHELDSVVDIDPWSMFFICPFLFISSVFLLRDWQESACVHILDFICSSWLQLVQQNHPGVTASAVRFWPNVWGQTSFPETVVVSLHWVWKLKRHGTETNEWTNDEDRS